MLQPLREKSGKWFIKILFGAIILSFAFFGISDIIKNYQYSKPVAKVGTARISYEEYAKALHSFMGRLQHITKNPLDIEELSKMGMHDKVLDQLISEKLIMEEIETLKIMAPDTTIRDIIQQTPEFQVNGKFSKETFLKVLKQAGFSEGNYIKSSRRNIQLSQFFDAYFFGYSLPEIYIKTLFDVVNQKRTFSIITIPIEKILLNKKKPSEEELETFLNAHPRKYKTPEYRQANILHIRPLKKDTSITEEELKSQYEESIQLFKQPEKRTVRRFTVLKAKGGTERLEKIKNKKEIDPKTVDVDDYKEIKEVEHFQLDKKIADTIFSLSPGLFTNIIETPTSYIIYQLIGIHPASEKTFNLARPELEKIVKERKEKEALESLRNIIEDGLAAGQSLPDLAKEYKLELIQTSFFDQSGRSKEGDRPLSVYNFSTQKTIIDNIFSLQVGENSPLIDTEGFYLLLVNLEKVIPSSLPKLRAIRETILKDFDFYQKEEKARKLSETIQENSKNVKDFINFAREYNLFSSSQNTLRFLDIKTDSNLKKEDKNLTVSIKRQIFNLPLAGIFASRSHDGKSYVLVMLEKVEKGEINKEDFEKISKNINQMFKKEQTFSIEKALHYKHKISIDQDILNRFKNF